VPLLNFTSDFLVVIEELHNHPLRTRQTSPYELVSGDARIYHELAYQQGNALIALHPPRRDRADAGMAGTGDRLIDRSLADERGCRGG
jgi:hypothetical protein